MLQLHCHAERLFVVGPGAFTPPPKVESAIVRLVPRDRPAVVLEDEARFAQVVKQAFGQRRKTLRNTLRGLIDEQGLRALDIDPGLRAEVLGLEQFARIANSLND